MKQLQLLLILLLFNLSLYATDSLRVCIATRVATAPKIDGKLDESVWKDVPSTGQFTQRQPYDLQPPSQRTEIRIVYTDYAVYIGAMLFDSSPDSILKQLGIRDQDNLNADRFYFKIDPYHNHQDAYQFGVYASGIQLDSKFSDYTYDGVWNSAIGFIKEGWIAEIEIPYSCIRMPELDVQEWGLQFTREIRRKKEFDMWAYIPLTANNPQIFWGKLEGISKVKTPIRLSFTPYVSANVERAPVYDDEGNYKYSSGLSYNIGADLKYGIDDRFTLDMSLFPDFGQVQSDKTIKNLSYRETIYDENRPFFKEGLELFNKGDLFYSRRIGKVPSGYYSVFNNLEEGEKVEDNPSQVKLLNATKISGRTNSGLGIGFFNALTNNTYAAIQSSDLSIRKILTEPLANYNILVLDQQFSSNSNIYLINTSTLRSHNFNDANVSGMGIKLSNKKSTLSISSNGFISKKFISSKFSTDNKKHILTGYKYSFGADKSGGNFNYGLKRIVIDPEFNTSDLGYYIVPGTIENGGYFSFNLYKPWKFIRDSYNTFSFDYNTDFKTGKVGYNETRLNLYITTLSYFGYFLNAGMQPIRSYDYYEARTDDRVFHGIKYYYLNAGGNSDYRKILSFDYSFQVSNFIEKYLSEGYNADLGIRFRASDKFFIKYNFSYNVDPYNLGFANIDDNGEIIFGLRKMDTYVNEINANYIFQKDMSLSIITRHYWNTGKYRKYLTLLENGELEYNYIYSNNNDFNFNAFNIDLVYEWRFAPGSVLNIIFKKGIQEETDAVKYDFGKNIHHVLNAPQTNTIAIKFLYYLDYLKLKNTKQ